MSTVYTITDLVGDGGTFTGDAVDAGEWLAGQYADAPAEVRDAAARVLVTDDAAEYHGLCALLGLSISIEVTLERR